MLKSLQKKNKLLILLNFLIVLSLCNIENSFGQEKEPEAVLKNISFDKNTGAVSYELTVPARVRVRIGVPDGPLYRTICDWEERDIGKHQEAWDGIDPSGTFKLTGREDLAFTFNYFTAGNEYLRNVEFADVQPPAGNISGRHLPNLKVNQLHKAHIRERCHEPKIKIGLPRNIRKTKENFYIVKNKIPIEITIDDADKTWFRSERYTLHIFIDDVFVQGELDGYTPYTWVFDPEDLNEGKHLIVVNLAGFDDHYGIGSLPVYIKKKKGIRYVFSKK